LTDGKKIHDFKATTEAEVFYARAQPVQYLRKAAQHASQIRRLPHMLPRIGVQRPYPRRQKGKLVAILTQGR